VREFAVGDRRPLAKRVRVQRMRTYMVARRGRVLTKPVADNAL
jgi:hypothetical protein